MDPPLPQMGPAAAEGAGRPGTLGALLSSLVRVGFGGNGKGRKEKKNNDSICVTSGMRVILEKFGEVRI